MSDPTNTTAPASPFASPATTTAPASPFAAPATTATPATPAQDTPTGDTSFLDNLSAREPLIKPCIVPGVIVALSLKTASNGNPFVSISVQLFGDKMVFEDGTPISAGKQLTSSVFASSNSEEWLRLTGQELKGLMLALHDVPLDAKADATYASWPPSQKPTGPVRQGASFVFNMSCLEPTDRWVGTKVLVQVKAKKNKQTGETRNEFTLLAPSTKPVERKGRA